MVNSIQRAEKSCGPLRLRSISPSRRRLFGRWRIFFGNAIVDNCCSIDPALQVCRRPREVFIGQFLVTQCPYVALDVFAIKQGRETFEQ